jgi:hypothetical protein
MNIFDIDGHRSPVARRRTVSNSMWVTHTAADIQHNRGDICPNEDHDANDPESHELPGYAQLFDGDGLGQVSWLVDVVTAGLRHRRGEHLKRDGRQQRLQKC